MSDTTETTESPAVKKRSIWYRLYHGETDVQFVGRWKLWFTISLVAVLIGLLSLFTRGLNLGIDFEGGVVWDVPAGDASLDDVRDVVAEAGVRDATVLTVDNDDEGRSYRVESGPLPAAETDAVTVALAEVTGESTDSVSLNSVGPSWGREISDKAIRALAVFLVLVTLYITLRFQLKMAIPTLVALVHDVLITVGVYSVTQFEVTPATVIAILTILGFSIYDGIVVFDKVDENTRMVSSTGGGTTYSDMVNLSLNQALMRTLNTSITALLPVASLLVIGSWVMGASTLEEFALALLVGLFSGAYSSIFIASPLLALLKEREPRNRDIRRRIEARAAAGTPAAPAGRKAASAPLAKPTRKAKALAKTRRGRGAAADDTDDETAEPDDVEDELDAETDADADVGADEEGEPDVAVPSGGNGGKSPAPRTDRVIPPRPRKKSKGRRR